MAQSLPATGLAYLLSQLGHHAAARFARELAALELTPQQVGILRLLVADEAPYTQRALCEHLGVFPSRLVTLLDQLEAQGLVERQPHPTDRRSNVLHATEAGHARFARAAAVSDGLDESLASALSGAERAELLRLLSVIAAQEELIPGVHPAYRQESP